VSGALRRASAALGLAVVLFAADAALFAAEAAAGSRIVVLQFSGRKADVLRDQVVQSLKDAGHSVVLSRTSSSRAKASDIRRIARKAKADAVVTGTVRRHSMRLWSVSLNVNDGEEGNVLGKEVRIRSTWLPGLAKELADTAATRLEPGLEQVGVAPMRSEPKPEREEPEEEPEPEPPASKESGGVWNADAEGEDAPAKVAPESDASEAAGAEAENDALFEVDSGVIAGRDEAPEASEDSGGGAVVVLRARGGLVRRTLNFSDDLYRRLRAQSANIWVYQVDGALYPFERPIGERLGLIASFEGVFSGNVRDADFGNNFPVVFQEVFGGLRARHPLGRHEIGFDLTFGRMLAGLEDANGAARIPDMDYTVLRSALDFSIDLGRLKAVGSAGFRLPFAYGEVSDDEWFPRVGGYGLEAAAGAHYPVSKKVSLELSAGLRRYLLEMNSEPQDAIDGVAEVAGGAVDLYLSAYIGMSFKL
jgi:hypothetical protein